VIVALATLLMIEVLRSRRSSTPIEPNAEEPRQDLPIANRL